LELRQLQYFVKVARKQHVTQAAEELHVAQSAVSRQIRQLEDELGVRLFVPKGRNLQLTPVGKMFLTRVEELLTDLDRVVAEIREFLDPEVGEIGLGFPSSLGIHLVPSVVADFRKNHPNVKFRLKQGTFTSLIRDVVKGDIDLAFISPFPESNEHVAGKVVLTEELYAVLPHNHMLADYHSIRLEQLKNDPFVVFNENFSLRAIVLEACRKAGFSPQISFEGEETDTIRGLVAAGMGVSLLPEMALAETSPLMPAKVKISEPHVTRTIGIIRKSGIKLPVAAAMFYQFLLEYFELRP